VKVSVREAKTNFSKLLRRVILGDEVIITKAGVPVAKLVRFVSKEGKRPLGSMKGEIWMADDFNAPLELVESSKLAALTAEKAGTSKKKVKVRRPTKKGRRQ
jgi:antitoxin (DNA-binding transcriptional repressor) of toxin-antitoxin stability system